MGRLGFTAHNITTHHPPGGVKSTASSASTGLRRADGLFGLVPPAHQRVGDMPISGCIPQHLLCKFNHCFTQLLACYQAAAISQGMLCAG